MSINIKNPEVHALAKELAELTGESDADLFMLFKGDDFGHTDITSAL